VMLGIIGQAFPYTPIANPRYFVPDWTFGIKEAELQKQVEEVNPGVNWGRLRVGQKIVIPPPAP